MARPHHHWLFDLDCGDPDFHRKMITWAFQAQSEMHETVLTTKETIAATRVMMVEADRILARRNKLTPTVV